MSKTKIQITPQGQYWITIPSTLAKARGLQKSQEAEWKIRRDGRIEVVL